MTSQHHPYVAHSPEHKTPDGNGREAMLQIRLSDLSFSVILCSGFYDRKKNGPVECPNELSVFTHTLPTTFIT